ncbi:MAG: hypothetical protein U9O49_00050 [Candidatus Thermoplasmatota archaeon]|nr:hypothetical protein [Candidatus Thermoplasmatota archaeon]
MKKRINPHKEGRNKTVAITVKVSLGQHRFIKENDLNPDKMLQNAIKIEKQKKSQELQQIRKKVFV